MSRLNTLAYSAVLLFAAASALAEAPSAAQPAKAAPAAEQTGDERPERQECIRRCNNLETHCSSDVRRARQECSRRAALGNRDPMTMEDDDLAYFCGFFENPGRCGSGYFGRGCAARFQQRYGVCMDAMQRSIVGLRHDCVRAERDAQKLCRAELRDCKTQCD